MTNDDLRQAFINQQRQEPHDEVLRQFQQGAQAREYYEGYLGGLNFTHGDKVSFNQQPEQPIPDLDAMKRASAVVVGSKMSK